MSNDGGTEEELLRETLRDGLPDRRERIATAALQGLLANATWLSETKGDVIEAAARNAAAFADALIAELDGKVQE